MKILPAVVYYDDLVMFWFLEWSDFFRAQTDCEPNESYLMIPSWDVFEEASQ